MRALLAAADDTGRQRTKYERKTSCRPGGGETICHRLFRPLPTSGLDFQHDVFCQVFHSDYSLKVHVFDLRGMGQTDRQTDREMDGRLAALFR